MARSSKRSVIKTGDQFGRLTVLALVEESNLKDYIWRCRCVCGSEVRVKRSHLRNGSTKSCGCLRREDSAVKLHILNFKHGESLPETPEFRAWSAMIQRCTNPATPGFKNWGGRGIDICVRWRNSYSVFLADMGRRPSPVHTLERRNNAAGYDPENCYWATMTEQQRNKRSNHLLTFNNITQCISAWADQLNMPYHRLHSRIKRGWSAERALTT